MRRASWNFLIDLVSFLFLLFLGVTGFVMVFILPSGTGGRGREISGGQGRFEMEEFLGLARGEWSDVHFYAAIIFLLLMFLHLLMHWGWLKSYFRRR